eukprot:767893-Hanusia_phi.AAC.1
MLFGGYDEKNRSKEDGVLRRTERERETVAGGARGSKGVVRKEVRVQARQGRGGNRDVWAARRRSTRPYLKPLAPYRRVQKKLLHLGGNARESWVMVTESLTGILNREMRGVGWYTSTTQATTSFRRMAGWRVRTDPGRTSEAGNHRADSLPVPLPSMTPSHPRRVPVPLPLTSQRGARSRYLAMQTDGTS